MAGVRLPGVRGAAAIAAFIGRPEGDARRIDELLDNPQRAEAMGDRAREVARTTYSQDAIADKLEDFYRKIIAAKSASN